VTGAGVVAPYSGTMLPVWSCGAIEMATTSPAVSFVIPVSLKVCRKLSLARSGVYAVIRVVALVVSQLTLYCWAILHLYAGMKWTMCGYIIGSEQQFKDLLSEAVP